jgi:hypothetical protein
MRDLRLLLPSCTIEAQANDLCKWRANHAM